MPQDSLAQYLYLLLPCSTCYYCAIFVAVRHVNPSNSRRSRFQTLEIEKAPYIHVHTLLIMDVRPTDFGNYTCFARSSVETAKEVVLLQRELPSFVVGRSKSATSWLLSLFLFQVFIRRRPPPPDLGVFHRPETGT